MSRFITFKNSFHGTHHDNEIKSFLGLLAPHCTFNPFEMWQKQNSPGWPHPHPPKCWDDRSELWAQHLPASQCLLPECLLWACDCTSTLQIFHHASTNPWDFEPSFPASTYPVGFRLPDHGHLAGSVVCLFPTSFPLTTSSNVHPPPSVRLSAGLPLALSVSLLSVNFFYNPAPMLQK